MKKQPLLFTEIKQRRRITLFQLLGRDRSIQHNRSASIKKKSPSLMSRQPLYDNYLTEQLISLDNSKTKSRKISIQDDFPSRASVELKTPTPQFKFPLKLQSIVSGGQMNINVDQMLLKNQYIRKNVRIKL